MELDTVGSLGEFGIISRITKGLPAAPAVSVGPGDDAAVFLVNGSSVTSVDVLVEGVHFRRDWVPAEMLGRRAVAVAAADNAVLLVVIDGMGGHAEGARAAETALSTLLEAFWQAPHPPRLPAGPASKTSRPPRKAPHADR